MLCLSCAKVYSRVNAVNQVMNERQNPHPPGAYILVNVNTFFCLMKKKMSLDFLAGTFQL